MAGIVSGYEFAGKGAAVQLLGLLLPIVAAALGGAAGAGLGILLGLVLFAAGSSMSKIWRCGACRNKLPDRRGKNCTFCKSTLEPAGAGRPAQTRDEYC